MFLLVDQLTKDGLLPKIDQGDNASKWNILKKKHQVRIVHNLHVRGRARLFNLQSS